MGKIGKEFYFYGLDSLGIKYAMRNLCWVRRANPTLYGVEIRIQGPGLVCEGAWEKRAFGSIAISHRALLGPKKIQIPRGAGLLLLFHQPDKHLRWVC